MPPGEAQRVAVGRVDGGEQAEAQPTPQAAPDESDPEEGGEPRQRLHAAREEQPEWATVQRIRRHVGCPAALTSPMRFMAPRHVKKAVSTASIGMASAMEVGRLEYPAGCDQRKRQTCTAA